MTQLTNKEKEEFKLGKEVTFEKALESLEKIVEGLEKENIDLDEAIKSFSEGMKMAKICREKLDNAEKQVNKILTENGKVEKFEN